MFLPCNTDNFMTAIIKSNNVCKLRIMEFDVL